MKKSAFTKDLFMDIKKSKGRFFSILAIIALGVAFFSGIKSAPIAMKKTTDKYYDDYNFMDFTVYSTLGFNDEDIKEISNIDGISEVFPTHSLDALIKIDSSEVVLKVMEMPLDNDNFVNKYRLIEGRFPSNEKECVIEAGKINDLNISIGDTINLISGTKKSLDENLNNTSYTVVGKVQTPNYLSYEKGTSEIGTGKVSSFIVIPEGNFKLDTYTEVYLTVSNSKELDTYSDEYKDLINSIKPNIEELGNERASIRYNEIISNAKEEIEKNRAKLEEEKQKGLLNFRGTSAEYNNLKEKFDEEFLEAENKINKSEEDLKNIPEGKWFVLDRDSHYSFVDYKNNAESINKLAKVFPVFFFLVAALVCLTTMTRMVDEQRINIGTLKALGYSKYKIISKYIIYAFLASFIGSLIGLSIGSTVFPIVVFDAYGIMYSLPNVELGFNVQISLIIIVIAVLVTTIASFSACYKELMETPSVLMRPKAPKSGKRILLERFTPFWNKLSFTGKVTTRNIFRYKKRFLMTVFGIAGCTALILTGFGIKDSIKTIVDRQFGYILKYNMSINLDKNISSIEKENIISNINNIDEIENTLMILSSNIKIDTGKGEKDGYIIVPENTFNFSDFINLENRKSNEKLSLRNEGIIISEKVAKQSNIHVGDFVNIKLDNSTYSLEVIEITENYTFNYIYMNKDYYKKIFNKEPIYNTILANVKEIQNEDDFSKTLMQDEGIKGVSFNTSIKENFDNTIKSLNSVILIMIISAGALAFIVLYNLTNVNISERIREIATIKVLGFYDKEVSAYIYRENIILTILGICLGEFIGIFLHRFIMVTVEIDNMMFGRNIDYKSFVFSALLTIIFSIMVNIAMYYKLKKVQMVESLKSVD